MTPKAHDGTAPGDRLLLALLVVGAVGVPLLLSYNPFLTADILRLTLLWAIGIAVLFVGVYRTAVLGRLERSPVPVAATSAGLLVALVVTSLLSRQTWVSFTGLTVRGAGALTYGLCLGLLHAVFRLGRRRTLEPLVQAFAVAHAVVVLYALLQAYGLDPLSWNTQDASYYGAVFSTLGNPNFASGFVGLTLPLLVWIPFGSTYPSAVKAGSGAMVGASLVILAYLGSFQGYAAGLVAVGVVAHWMLTRPRSDRLMATLAALPVAAAIGGLPLVANEPSVGVLLGVMAILALCAVLATKLDRPVPSVADEGQLGDATGRLWLWSGATLALVVAAGLVLADRIREGVESGLENRLELWKTSLSIFTSSPLTGTGLETYPDYFMAHRTIELAVEYETSLVDAPHSVPLSVLTGGGVLLAVPYLGILLIVGYFGIQAVRKAERESRLFFGAVLAAWVAYQIQASVSIEVPGLIFTQWILGGILLAGGIPGSLEVLKLPWKPQRPSRARPRIVGAGLIIVFLVLLFGPVSAPARADMAAYRGQLAVMKGDSQAATEEFLYAVELQPRNGFYAEKLADLYEQSEQYESAFEERERIAYLKPGDRRSAVLAVRAAVLTNRLDVAGQWHERAVQNDPYGGGELVEAANFFARTEREDRARELLARFEKLHSTNLRAWQRAGEVFAFLGEDAAAEHAAGCAEASQVGCWTNG
jgi:tetratricopeptide (TPR) repeat protein